MPESLPSITIARRVEWVDTDASGFYHNGFVTRLLESAEAELYRTLGIERVFGAIPRVRLEISFLRRLAFGDLVEGRLDVLAVGRTSLTFGFEIRRGDEVAATARAVVAHAPPGSERAEPWPDDVRRALAGGA